MREFRLALSRTTCNFVKLYQGVSGFLNLSLTARDGCENRELNLRRGGIQVVQASRRALPMFPRRELSHGTDVQRPDGGCFIRRVVARVFMFADRDKKFDLVALGLLAAVVFLAVSLVTYDPADRLVELVYPLNQWIHQDLLSYPLNDGTANACGPWGALASALLLKGLGLGAYYAVASLGTLTVLLLLRREISSPVLRTMGWLMSLVGFTTIVAMTVTGLSPGSMWGPGGALGALISTIFRVHFASVGGFLLAVSLFLGGLLLCTDYVLVHAGLMLGSLTMAGLMGIRGESATRAPRRAPRVSADEDAEQEDTEQDVVAVRVGGRQITRSESTELSDDLSHDELDEGEEDSSDEESDTEECEDEEYDECDEDDELDEQESEQPAASLLGSTIAAAGAAARRGRRRLAALRVRTPEPENREVVMQQLDEASEREDQSDYDLPSIDLLRPGDDFSYEKQTVEVRNKAKVLEKTFQSFGFTVKVVEIETGPVIAQYEVELESGLRLSKITGLADDLAIALRVPSVRIVAPIPGKNTVGIEVPNDERQLVRLREVIEESNGKTKKMRVPIFLGQDVSGNPLTVDLAAMPHLLIAGRTGTGKSVCLNAIITSILMTRKPDEVRMLMIDPKMVELSGYKSLPHLMHPVVTDMRKAEAILAWAVDKMEERYALLAQAGVRHLAGYNQLGREELLNRIQPENEELAAAIPTNMPYIVIVADEIADMMMTAGKDVEQHIIRLAQKSRAVGIHLILATQKPTVDVITGLIKSNLPARVAFQVASRTDSRVVLDEMGAERLLGNGDMLFLWPGTSTLLRGQGTFVSDDEINAVVAAVSTGEQNFVTELVDLKVEDPESDHTPASLKKRDDLYERAIEIVVTEGRGSVSLLQRALGIGYGRAARLIDFMAEDGIVGTYAGSQAREVLLSMADVRRMMNGLDGDEADHGQDVVEPLPARRQTAKTTAARVKTPVASTAAGNRSSGPSPVRTDRPAARVLPRLVVHDDDMTDSESWSETRLQGRAHEAQATTPRLARRTATRPKFIEDDEQTEDRFSHALDYRQDDEDQDYHSVADDSDEDADQSSWSRSDEAWDIDDDRDMGHAVETDDAWQSHEGDEDIAADDDQYESEDDEYETDDDSLEDEDVDYMEDEVDEDEDEDEDVVDEYEVDEEADYEDESDDEDEEDLDEAYLDMESDEDLRSEI